MQEQRALSVNLQPTLEMGAGLQAKLGRATRYTVECVRDGQVIWSEEFHNLVVDEGLNDSLDKQFKASNFNAAWYVGLTEASPTFAASDTLASHPGWTESQAYSDSTRRPLVLGTVASKSVDNTASKASFAINGTVTIGGGFITAGSAKGGASGVLYGGGAFSANRSAIAGDTINVTVTLTAAAV